MICSWSNLEFVAHPTTDRAKFPVRFPIDNKFLSFDLGGFAKVRRHSINFHSLTTLLAHSIANDPVLGLKQVVAREIRTCARGSSNKTECKDDEQWFHAASPARKTDYARSIGQF
jgi:hypothetical protein